MEKQKNNLKVIKGDVFMLVNYNIACDMFDKDMYEIYYYSEDNTMELITSNTELSDNEELNSELYIFAGTIEENTSIKDLLPIFNDINT